MKLKSTFLALAVLLLTGSLASAGQISAQADLASTNLAAIFSDPASTGCADTNLPSFEPTPINKAVLCGTCSDTLCQGKQFGQTCKVQGGKIYTCRFAVIVCEARDCQCWNGPLP